MPIQLYDPFEKFDFNSQTCFLTGENLNPDEEQITVFPQWILERYALHDKKFSMMDNVTELRYRDIKIPCAKGVIETALIPLENEIKNAFAGGYDEVVKRKDIRFIKKKIPHTTFNVAVSRNSYGIFRFETLEYSYRKNQNF
jgi:hypothetical protein